MWQLAWTAALMVVATLAEDTGQNPATPTDRATPPSTAQIVEDQPYTRHTVVDALGREITYYISEPPDGAEALPIMVYVQGSGCGSHFARINGRIASTTGHSVAEETGRGRVRTLLVDKPGVTFLDAPESPGTAEHASEMFKQEHTLDRWAQAIISAIHAAWQHPGVDQTRTLVAGHSEGGLVAGRVAALEPRVTGVAVLAGEGPTQLYSLLKLAEHGKLGDPERTPLERRAWLLAGLHDIQEDPESASRLFLGHPHRRWSSFLVTSPVDQLRKTDAAVFIAQGALDDALQPETAEVLYAELLANNRRAALWLVPNADHSFNTFEDEQITGSVFSEAFDRAIAFTLES